MPHLDSPLLPICKRCKANFTSNNQLHEHLRNSCVKHQKKRAKASRPPTPSAPLPAPLPTPRFSYALQQISKALRPPISPRSYDTSYGWKKNTVRTKRAFYNWPGVWSKENVERSEEEGWVSRKRADKLREVTCYFNAFEMFSKVQLAEGWPRKPIEGRPPNPIRAYAEVIQISDSVWEEFLEWYEGKEEGGGEGENGTNTEPFRELPVSV